MADRDAARPEQDCQETPRCDIEVPCSAAGPARSTAARHRREAGAGFFDRIIRLMSHSDELSAVPGATNGQLFEEPL